MSRRAAFIDRDGVINALQLDPASGLFESPLSINQVSILPGVISALQMLNEAEWLVVCVTNQPAAAKGRVAKTELSMIHARVLELVRDGGATIDHSEICFHHPDGVIDELSEICDCRKPAPGMLLAAAARFDIALGSSWMIGDSESDVEAGRRSGTRTVLIEHGPSAHRRKPDSEADHVVMSLLEAVRILLVAETR